MVGIGLWIRLGITETPVFQKVLDEERVERVPVLEVLKRQPKQVALTALLRMPEQAPGYIIGTFIFTYATTVLGAPRNFVLMAVLTQAVIRNSLGPGRRASIRPHRAQAHVYDRVSLCRDLRLHLLCLAGYESAGVDVYCHCGVVAPSHDVLRPQAALIAESFPRRLRYSGASLGYQLASIIAGGPSPFIATALFATYHSSLPIALYILLCGIIGITATALLTDYTNKDISAEYESV